jgi:GNAT superfamily N-acetyltransferase
MDGKGHFMIKKVNEADFSTIKNLVEAQANRIPTFAYSVMDGMIRGTIYSDAASPNSILVGTGSGIYFAAGDYDNQQFNHFLNDLYQQRKKQHLRFSLFSSSKEWDKVLKEQYSEELRQMSRYSFVFEHQQAFDFAEALPSTYHLQQIDEKIISASIEFNKRYYREYWGSVSNFIRNGFGYAIIHEGKPVSECTSIFSSERCAEIDIATHKDHRGKGLAFHTAKAFINHCLMNDLNPRWDCDETNDSSIHLARKLGFSDPAVYSIFY